ncbi:hypothetical protein PAXRUDRAFT_824125 [Paxillus rubicundulus Ve08.2h10]|uniref:Uncharacterized protein n=1 Tax=Paxillus rubicundulus Ve08.2h10 TaxID=930991 RepID=A0A0D0DUR8_9AGAM|nr:hypothetical protein PAXRUDRAFT_824125 [Paxillus rubicundulus Ve08.2h10]
MWSQLNYRAHMFYGCYDLRFATGKYDFLPLDLMHVLAWLALPLVSNSRCLDIAKTRPTKAAPASNEGHPYDI